MTIQINDIYVPIKEFKDEIPFKEPHRVVGIDRNNGIIVLFSLANKSRAPFNFSLEAFEHLLANRRVQEGSLEPLGYMLNMEVSDRDREIYESRRKLIEPFLDKKDDRWLFDKTLKGKLVTQQMKKFKCPRRTVLRWIYHYLKFGMTLGALNCGFSRRGGFRIIKAAGEKKRGRPTNAIITGHDMSLTGININEELRTIFQTFKDIYYSVKDGRGLSFVLNKIKEKFFSTVVLSPTGEEKHRVWDNAPTIRQLRYWHAKDGDSIYEIEQREGSRRFKLKHRGLGGRAEQNCNGPTDKYELDSTVLDLYCVSAFNRSWIIGRPILYFVVDTYSRMIVGFHLALSGPNWNEARVALFNAFTDKVSFCASAGVEITGEEWPCEHLPQTVLVDRGEMRAHKPRGLIKGLGVEVDLAPPFRGDFKSVVERRFRILHDMAIKWIPGAVRARGIERGERDYRLDAILTLDEVKKVIIRCVLQHNKYHEFPDLLTRQMINDGVVPTPISIWNWGLENIMGSPRKVNKRSIFCHLLPQGTASVHADGLWWNGIRYTCETEIAENWRAKARNKGTWRLPIRYMPDSTNHIWLFDEREGSFEECDILSHEERYRDIRVDECVDAVTYQKLEASDRKPDNTGAIIDDDTYFNKMVAEARALKKT